MLNCCNHVLVDTYAENVKKANLKSQALAPAHKIQDTPNLLQTNQNVNSHILGGLKNGKSTSHK